MKQPQPKRAGYIAHNRGLNYLMVVVGVVWAIMEWVTETWTWFGGAILLIVLSVINLITPSKDDAKANKPQT